MKLKIEKSLTLPKRIVKIIFSRDDLPLSRFCTKIEFQLTDSCVLQFIHAFRTLQWPPTKLRNSVRF